MNKIAVISDIHGNIPALEATLADIRERDIKHIYCLGDLVGKGPQSALAVDMIREQCEVVIRGNWDDFMPLESDNVMTQWNQEQLGQERLAYLGALPNVVDFQMSGKRVRLFHASQTSVHKRIHMDDSYETHLEMFANTEFTGYVQPEPDVVGYGDIHAVYVRALYLDHKTLFNAGSVGNPLDEPLATYVILEGRLHSDVPAPFGLQIVRLPYDIERVIEIAREMDMPEIEPFAIEVRTAVYRGRQVKPTPVSQYEQIYIPLLEEGTPCSRPTVGERITDEIFRVFPTENYDPEDEIWEFPPGTIVKCVIEERHVGSKRKKVLVAKEEYKVET
ncbi:MAG: metallophosphoesterase family protein [Ardenticatenales bacterium]|nr:metallophosphoesterase family protein [Ardenticatenales bacterium]